VPADEASLAIYREFLRRGAARSVQLPSRGDAPQAMIENTLASFANGAVEATLARIWDDLAGDTFLFYYRHEGFEEFLKDARETADEFPTSFYGNAMYGRRWSIVREWELAGGDDGWIGTAIVETIASDGRLRNWIWELRKRRPKRCQKPTEIPRRASRKHPKRRSTAAFRDVVHREHRVVGRGRDV
jgi:hypothetical protein